MKPQAIAEQDTATTTDSLFTLPVHQSYGFINVNFSRRSAVKLYLFTLIMTLIPLIATYFFVTLTMIDILNVKNSGSLWTTRLMLSLPLERIGSTCWNILVVGIVAVILSIALVVYNSFRLGIITLPALTINATAFIYIFIILRILQSMDLTGDSISYIHSFTLILWIGFGVSAVLAIAVFVILYGVKRGRAVKTS